MNAGRAEQIGTPAEVYGKPATTFVASFIGSPPMNLLRGKISADGTRFEPGSGMAIELAALPRVAANQECLLGLRPEHLVLGRPGISADVEMVEALGADLLVHALVAGQPIIIRAPAGTAVAAGQRVTAGFAAESVHWFDSKTSQRIA
jgi:sn-glycerol 3-phosphate transport system ATP-binding protein